MHLDFRTGTSVSQDKACSMAELTVLSCQKMPQDVLAWSPESKSARDKSVSMLSFGCLELMCFSVHDTSYSCAALLWLFDSRNACCKKYHQCFSGGVIIIYALLIKSKLTASQVFVKVSRSDNPS